MAGRALARRQWPQRPQESWGKKLQAAFLLSNFGGSKGQCDREGGTPTDLAIRCDRAAMCLNDTFHDRQAQARPFAGQLGREEGRKQLRLDVAQESGVAYLNVLRARTSLRIQRDNLMLTRSNLELARVRESVGYAARDEVFRWQNERATAALLCSTQKPGSGILMALHSQRSHPSRP